MGAVTIGLLIESSVTWLMLLLLWRRDVVVQRKLSEPRLIHDEMPRQLSNSNATVKAMLNACPPSDHPGLGAQRRNLLSAAVAGVGEFASRSEEELQIDYQ